jgi:hypothetical protein
VARRCGRLANWRFQSNSFPTGTILAKKVKKPLDGVGL